MVKHKRIITSVMILAFILFSSNFLIRSNFNTEESSPIYFSLVAKTNYGGVRPEFLYILHDELLDIGINLTVITQDWPTFAGELLAFRDFDICYYDLTGGEGGDPDFNGLYNEEGFLNLFGYDTSMDWDEDPGTGINEWYMQQGKFIVPPDSGERIQHYWDWEQYLMTNLLPMQPTFASKDYTAYWSGLNGFNFTDGLVQSWGKMYWSDLHYNQSSTEELRVIGDQVDNLNPFILTDSDYPALITSAVIDPLLWIDSDKSVWPHLAENYVFLNDTHLRLYIRDDVKWQLDPDGLFPAEYLDVNDIYFTFYCLKYILNNVHLWNWIKSMEIVDNYTLDIFIDADVSTPQLEAYANCLLDLSKPILPEHYLNQSQLGDGITPDKTHISWANFANCSFGTGLFKVIEFIPNNLTKLELFTDSWWLDNSITNDPDLDWENRFGDFYSPMTYFTIYCPLNVSDPTHEFESGYIDILNLNSNYTLKNIYNTHPWYSTQSKLRGTMGFFGYNMREVRPFLGNRAPCAADPSITKGLAIRKAISYAMDRVYMNNEVNDGEHYITDWPIYRILGIWCNPNIIKYRHNLTLAQYYINLALSTVTPTKSTINSIVYIPGFTSIMTIISSITISTIVLLITKRKKVNE